MSSEQRPRRLDWGEQQDLLAVNARMRKALHKIGFEAIGPADAKDCQIVDGMTMIARAALAEEPAGA